MHNNHNAYLKAMDIDVWLERNPAVLDIVSPDAELSSVEIPASEAAVITAPERSIAVSIPTEADSFNNIEISDWQTLDSMVAECQNCLLSKTRTQTVFGAGNKTASLMIIGDAPSEQDEKQGDVFSGQSGKLLAAMLKAIGYLRNDVYTANIIKCRTPENQEPSENEAISCEPYLLRQIKLLQPKLILALGSVTAQRLLKRKSSMTRLRGQLHFVDGISAPIVVSYHPKYLLAAPNEKRKAWADLQIVMKELAIKESQV